MYEYDVTIVEAELVDSQMLGLPTFRVAFSPHSLCFLEGRVVHRLHCHMSNTHPMIGYRRAQLRRALGLSGSDKPFTAEELSSIVGRRLRVGVDIVEFQGVLRLRVMDFLCYSGVVTKLPYADNEYVYMMQVLSRKEGGQG